MDNEVSEELCLRIGHGRVSRKQELAVLAGTDAPAGTELMAEGKFVWIAKDLRDLADGIVGKEQQGIGFLQP